MGEMEYVSNNFKIIKVLGKSMEHHSESFKILKEILSDIYERIKKIEKKIKENKK